MRARYSTLLLPLVLLLFVGSSGCTKSDIMDAMEILGGSQGITIADIAQREAPKAWGGGSTGDKTKDAMLETGETMEKVQKAGALEDEAKKAMAKEPPDPAEAVKKLEEAVKLRPNDWGLSNRLHALQAEQGKAAPSVSPYNVCRMGSNSYEESPAEKRCWRNFTNDRGRELERSVERQKRQGSLVKCSTYKEIEKAYEWVARMSPSDAILGLKFTDARYEEMVAKYEQARAIAAHPGEGCSL